MLALKTVSSMFPKILQLCRFETKRLGGPRSKLTLCANYNCTWCDAIPIPHIKRMGIWGALAMPDWRAGRRIIQLNGQRENLTIPVIDDNELAAPGLIDNELPVPGPVNNVPAAPGSFDNVPPAPGPVLPFINVPARHDAAQLQQAEENLVGTRILSRRLALRY